MTDDPLPAARLSLLPAGGAPALDFPRFADSMAALASAVCVAVSGGGAARIGRTVTAVASLSPTPPSLLVSIDKDSALARRIHETRGFALALLARGQEETGDAFAGKREGDDRFTVGQWGAWPSGRPRLAGAAANIDCRLAGTVTLDTHCLFLGIPIGSDISDAPPLIWHRRAYGSI